MLFEIAKSLRSLTRSPIHAALEEAHRAARRHLHLEAGGTVPTHDPIDDQPDDREFVMPPDVDPMLVALAVHAKLRSGRTAPGDDPMQLLERRAGGRVALSRYNLLRLGDGHVERGRRFMHASIGDIRRRR